MACKGYETAYGKFDYSNANGILKIEKKILIYEAEERERSSVTVNYWEGRIPPRECYKVPNLYESCSESDIKIRKLCEYAKTRKEICGFDL